MENCGNTFETQGARVIEIKACSACPGDYEDPDRTAQENDEADEEDEIEFTDSLNR